LKYADIPVLVASSLIPSMRNADIPFFVAE